MKYQTARFADGTFTINCPHCNGEVAVDEGQLEQINTALGGKFNCPIATCGQEIEFPTAEEAAALKAGGAVPAPAPAAPGLAPPPQSNPAAKPTTPPAEAPPSQPAPAAPAVEEPQPAAEPAPATAPPAAAPAAGGDDEIVAGFHGSKGASLEREAASVHRMSVKTILHAKCVKEKKDFDEEVSKFLSSVDEGNLVEVHPVQYTDDEKKGNDFGVMILFKAVLEED